jgi:hypothetical protein
LIYCRDILYQLCRDLSFVFVGGVRWRRAERPVRSASSRRKIGDWTAVGEWDFGRSPAELVGLCRERRGEILGEDRFTVVQLADDIVIKHRKDPLILRLRQLHIRSVCLREHDRLAKLAALGLRTPSPRGAAARFAGPILMEDILVTNYEKGMTNLGYTRRAGLPIDRSIAVPALIALAKDIRRVHDSGHYVNTLADRNVLVGPDGRYVVLDLDFAGRWGRPESDLGSLDKGLSRSLSRSDRLRLLAAYLGGEADAGERRKFVKRLDRMRHRVHKKGTIARWAHAMNRRLRSAPFLRRHLR